jgi:hypothetical protein
MICINERSASRRQQLIPNDISQAPTAPQYQLGATSDEAKMASQIAKSPIPGPGGIVERLGQQFQYPRASPDAQMSQRPGINVGES